ncbi:glycosyltransferase family 39 protein [bacterium]|nr:glycosyltransferase family 39 protein [bacterium]
MRSELARLVAAIALLAGGGLLLVPAAAPAPPRSWEELIAPYAVGQEVTRGYVLSPPRRGAAHDVVFVARRAAGPSGPAGRVEVHIVDRGQWSGVLETRSFGIAWEVPPPGATMPASPEDSSAVTQALAAAVADNDTGFAAVDDIPLAAEPPPPLVSRVLDRLAGWRGALVGAALALALLTLLSARHGVAAAGLVLLALGLALRAPSLDLPFVRDQDVQRMFTGHSSLSDIATGVGLEDRHPPLYFFLLHAAQQLGQSEAVGRLPAVCAGALLGPAILLATRAMRRRVGAAAAIAALAVTVSPPLIAASREVSELPLFAVLVLGAAASLVAALAAPTAGRLAAVAVFHGLALWTYYLAPFLVAAHAAVLVAARPARRVAAGLAAGVLLGAPALLLGAATLWRDWGARDVARAFPGLAWGQHTTLQMLGDIGRLAVEAFGWPFLLLVGGAAVAGIARRDRAVVTGVAGTLAVVAGIAALSPIARVQAYYATAVLPLACVVLALVGDPAAVRWRRAWQLALVAVIALSSAPRLGGARSLYLPDADAFMPRFAQLIAARPERRVVTVAHYDKTLLAYYLARLEGRSIAWRSVDASPSKRLDALVLVHALDADSESAAVARLDALRAEGPLLVIERDAFLLPRVAAALSGCERLQEAPTARLVRCPARPATH